MPIFRQAPDPGPPIDADELLSYEEVANRRLRRRWALILSIMAVFAAVFGFSAKPALHAAKAWQARRAAAEVERLTGEHKWFEARAKLQDALLLWRGEPAAQRAAAIFVARTGNPRDAAPFWKLVEAARPLAAAEQREYAASLLAGGDLDEAEAHLRAAWPGAPAGTDGGEPADLDLAMQIAARRNHAPGAAALARRLLAAPAATPRQRLNACAALFAGGTPEAQADAWDAVRALAADPTSPESLEALLILARRAATTPPGADPAAGFPALPELIARIEAHPRAAIQHRLLALDLALSLDPSPAKRAAAIQSAADRFGGSKDDADLAAFAAWLYLKTEFARVLEIVPAERAAHDHALFLQRMDALGALDRWGEIRDALKSRKVAVDPLVEQMYLARCAEKLGEPQAAEAYWDGALAAAGNNAEKLLRLGQYAQKNGELPVAGKAFQAAVQAVPESHEACAALAGYYDALGETRLLRDLLATMRAVWPKDAAVTNDAAYFDALLGENLNAARDAARALCKAEPASLPHRVTLALCELRLGNALGGLDAFNAVSLGRTVMLPRQRAVHAAVLWANSFPGQAREELRDVSPDRLLPEERALVAPITASAN